ncbi:MAG: hypothetical protein NZ703_02000 [Gemmataceae bacterium]|nr:hypothetical protein [Gemmataceae bacterium]
MEAAVAGVATEASEPIGSLVIRSELVAVVASSIPCSAAIAVSSAEQGGLDCAASPGTDPSP